ncbi:LOW QUALITY PROTEIN: A disintegrin and metalloproteinase with thrombospondin motifs 20-like [Brienomyrus brachyistius]|uniref:LOW QUALITY PROTEIN: A disintegrin and metalloproteinase with thrombospondin motifs 20-like n=1 Tax=Brienomyrus brachyistius TaxID=42636 RepID=UPI0020B323B3|nr:LOW QUALITY PROTEIN: A disintegrin and metalloproteinase with thrombospondin motifs 20-like [Brienomyrus brachyistius]
MRLAIQLVRLTCHLLTLVWMSSEYRLHPKQEKFVKQLSSYEIVTPLRVNDFGETFPHALHYRRKRRSLEATFPGLRAHYRVDAFGQRFHLNLTADSGFISPSYTVTHVGGLDSNESFPQDVASDMRHCFFRGHVNAETEFKAIFSLCTGLIGTFTTRSGEYFLEPLMPVEGEEYDEEHNKPHLVYRHERKRRSSRPGSPEVCAVREGVLENENVLHSRRGAGEEADAHLSGTDSSARNFHSQSRQKRFLSYPRYVELMVTADAKMTRHHGHNLENYILTIMSVVAAIYRDPSVGNLITVTIVKLIVIHNEQDGPSISYNAASTLHSFCVWQQSQNVPDDNHPSHHDTALLITREDICRAKDKCDTLGLAELGTMCDPYRSCSISEENGLSASFTIAHELGHVFNMPHDDNPKCREAGMKPQYHVMAPMLNDETSPWTWSKCSRKYITDFLDTGYGECLLDEPELFRSYRLPPQLPGQLYSADKQCELMFGPGSQVCPYMRQCKRLWCTSTEGNHKGCRTQHMPLADGSDCGHGMHCQHGLCVSKDADLRPLDGMWGPWGPYSACSRPCGGGTKSTVRDCNKPEPRNGGRFCVGRRMKFRSCGTDPCPRDRRDFREEQCAQFDGRHFNINGLLPSVRWVPKYSGILMKDRCKLFCRVAGKTAYYQLRDRVIDGTQCSPDTNDICVQGLCRQAGCDHVLNSKARHDRCGVCGGDNSSCRAVSGTFDDGQYGYNIIVRIPAGATNIDITQTSYSGKPEDDNYLALSDSQSNFILNGNFVVAMFKREVTVKGAVIEYSGSDAIVERINCTDRTEEELVLQVLCVGNLHNPDVRYSFNIPVEEKLEKFVWSTSGSWQDCSRVCQGERRRKVTCVRKSDHQVASDQRCHQLPQPDPISEPCNTHCELRWHVAGRSECSVRCGPGHRTLDVQCVKYSRLAERSEWAEPAACGEMPKPPSRESCHGDCLLQSWHYSAWSQCSKTCGRGTRTRESYCMSSLGRQLSDHECAGLPRHTAETCADTACPEWASGEWSECLVTCGKGSRHREVFCRMGEETLNEQLCDPDNKPLSVGVCQLPECASWQVAAWGMCTVTCGHGYQMRAVRCVSGTYGETLDDWECNAASRPRDNQDCELVACPRALPILSTDHPADHGSHSTQWRYGSWTTCSVSCGRGTRARYVSCRDTHGGVADEAYCAHLSRPPESSACFQPCGQWRAGDWSPCSVTCGVGQTTRQVVCSTYHHQVGAEVCDPDERPAAEQECITVPCQSVYRPGNQPQLPNTDYPYEPGSHPGHSSWNVPSANNQWRTGPWGGCSSTCAGGFQRRVVVCQDLEGHPSWSCEEKVKPAETKSCMSGPCPQWNHGVWGECTQSCGGGSRTRLVVCQGSSGQRLNERSCDEQERPLEAELCNTQSCPGASSWLRRPWKPCSASCGRGTKQRDVTCIDERQTEVPAEQCAHQPRPRTRKACRAQRCPSWKANRWAMCSVSCGAGLQAREVYCRLRGAGRVREDLCDPLTRPPSTQPCLSSGCPHHTWMVHKWRECNVTCGLGWRSREVLCIDQAGRSAHYSLCDPGSKPVQHQSCRREPCQYTWRTGDWSECSVSCGPGIQQRMVICSKVHSSEDPPSHAVQTPPHPDCPRPHPADTQPCLLAECPAFASWTVGPWSECSQTCGDGVRDRRVACLTENALPAWSCNPAEMPKPKAPCHERQCDVLTSCKELQQKSSMKKDDEYYLRVSSRILQIYCAEMRSQAPKEYVTLRSGQMDNFSEVYGFRLQNPFECPFNGSRRRDCVCSNDYTAAGYTIFHKVRIDLSAMRIITTDLRFSQTPLGHAVPFGTAGDCYSAAKCPQGQFSINLTGTGLKIAEEAKWVSRGNYATAKVHRSEDGVRIYGRCGGFCGKCVPQSQSGLPVQVR